MQHAQESCWQLQVLRQGRATLGDRYLQSALLKVDQEERLPLYPIAIISIEQLDFKLLGTNYRFILGIVNSQP